MASIWLGLVELYGATGFVGDEIVKAAIKHYAPKAFTALDETVARLWELVQQGKPEEAESLVIEQGLEGAIRDSAKEVRAQALVLNLPAQENEFVGRAAALECIASHFFEVSRRWNMDLLLRGNFAGTDGVSLFQTQRHVGAKIQFDRSDIGFATAGAEQLLWVETRESWAAADAESRNNLFDTYRAAIIGFRKKSPGYFALKVNSETYRPTIFVDGGAMNVVIATPSELSMTISNEFWRHRVKHAEQRSIDEWAAGVKAMHETLMDMAGWLKLSADERALVEDPSKLFLAPDTPAA